LRSSSLTKFKHTPPAKANALLNAHKNRIQLSG
jgi:hypothetical protein